MAQVMSEMLAAHVLSHYDKFLEGVNTVSAFDRELQVGVNRCVCASDAPARWRQTLQACRMLEEERLQNTTRLHAVS